MKMAAGSTGKHRNQVFNRASGARATAFPRGDGANAARRDARTALGGVGMPQNRRWKVSRLDDENGRICQNAESTAARNGSSKANTRFPMPTL